MPDSMLDIIPYRDQNGINHYPSAARFLIEDGLVHLPTQVRRNLKRFDGVDITYNFIKMTPRTFDRYRDTIELLAYQEFMRYKDFAHWYWASLKVKLYLNAGGKKEGIIEYPEWNTTMWSDPEAAVYGPGYDVPKKTYLSAKIDDILETAKRYKDKVSKQKPFRVIHIKICIRQDK